MTSLWWIRRDLRLRDNAALHAGLQAGAVIPVFILDPHLIARTPTRRQAFLFDGLRALRRDLEQRGARLIIRRGEPVEVLRLLLAETEAGTVFAEEDYTPYARKRDARAGRTVPLELISGQTVHHPEFIVKSDGTPYTVYTPYARRWKNSLPAQIQLYPAPDRFPSAEYPPSDDLPQLPPSLGFRAGESEALRRLKNFSQTAIFEYQARRNRMDFDGTSSLSPYLRFGMLGMRQAVRTAQIAAGDPQNDEERRSADAWLNELIWREFYIQILYHFPRVSRTAFRPALANIPWRNNADEFKAWEEGRTGVPIVDAGMRQLSKSGWMHNRARMIAASYLVKDLLIDWHWGEAWFMENLLDGDPAANNGGWQWTAGTGTDAAPYFRIFNPVLQSQKFDPNGDYIRRWVPELAHLASREIHAPWKHGIKVAGYPEYPIMDHAVARKRTLRAYHASKSQIVRQSENRTHSNENAPD